MSKEILLENALVRAVRRFIANRKLLILTVIIITVIAMIITGVVLIITAQGFVPDDDISVIDAERHNDLVRLNIFRLSIIMFLIAAAGAVCIMLCKQVKLEYIYLVAALCLGTAYMIVITPFSAPDEHHHYKTSYIFSSHILSAEDPYIMNCRHADFSGLGIHFNVPDAYLRLMDEGIHIIRSQQKMVELDFFVETYTLDYPLPYIPQVLGISIARILGLSFFGVIYFGRFFSLVFYSLCVMFSIKKLKAFRLPIFLIGLLPMSLHQAAAISNDGFIFGISILLIAYSISCIYEKDMLRWRDYVILLALSMLLAPAKGAYFPIVFLVLLVAWRWRESIKWKAWLLAASIIVASIALTAVLIGTRTIALTGEQELNWEGGYNFTLSFVLENPWETVRIFLRTITYSRWDFFRGAFGERLSGKAIVLPTMHINIILVLLAAGVLYGKRDEWQPKIGHRVYYFVVSVAVVLLCLAAMFFGWTSDWHDVILGVQGRYFTPLIPLALLILRCRKLLVPYDFYRNAVIAAYIFMQCIVINYVLNHTIDKL